MRFLFAALLFSASLLSQTTGTVNIISGTVDLTQAVHTGPMISVATVDLLPATGCIAGETALVTSAAAGQQIYENKTAGTCAWTQQGSNPIIPPSPGYQPNQLLSGCGVEYTTGLSFTVGVCTYTIAGVTYTTAALASITLTTADPSNPRIDAIIVDNTSTVSIVTGTPATNPATPNIDPATQLALANILVPAGATTPGGVSSTLIYDENVEWTCTTSANLNCASTNNPYHGTKDIEATAAVLGNNVTLVDPASGTVDLANFNYLIVYIRSKAAWPTKASGASAARFLTLFWKNGATQKGLGVVVRDGQFGFSSSITTGYQQLYIPASAFGINGTPVTTLEILVSGNTGTSSIGFYLDEITLQSNTTVQPAPASSVPFSSILSGNNNNAAMVGSATMTLDLSATTTTNAFKTQVKAGATATANGALAYDSTNNNLHTGNTGADSVIPVTTVTPANGNCPQWVVVGGKIKLGDTGGACGGTPGGGIIGYSASSLTITAATYYFPIVGGGLPSTTETNVDTEAPSAATIANFYASFSVALGGGNSAVFTYRNNATNQSLTCTISGASATTCHDITHSFSVAAGDLLTIQVVTSGTIVVTPTLVMTAQFGTVGSNGTVNSGLSGQVAYYAANGTAVSGGPPGADLLAESHAFGTKNGSTPVENVTVAASATQNIVNYTGGSPGYVDYIFIGLFGSNNDANSIRYSTINVYIDGAGSPSISQPLANYFGAEYIGQPSVGSFMGRYIGANAIATNVGSGFYSYIPIPFSSQVKIDFVNGSSSHSIQLYAYVGYQTGVPNTWPRTRSLQVASGTVSGLTVNTVQTLVNATGLNPGRLIGVYLSIDSFPGNATPRTAPLEGDVKIFVDGGGTPVLQSSGTEDYFNSSNYFSQIPASSNSYNLVQSAYNGVTFTDNTNTWEAYRFHIMDPIGFSNALKVTWNAGDSTQVNFTGSVRLCYTVWYYTQ